MRRFRSAISGRWVTKLFARQNPATTVSETADAQTIKVEASGLIVQCQFCGEEVGWATRECPNCHADLVGDSGVPS